MADPHGIHKAPSDSKRVPARKPDAPERPEAPGKRLRATCRRGHEGMGVVA
jgi:hypothetical protein